MTSKMSLLVLGGPARTVKDGDNSVVKMHWRLAIYLRLLGLFCQVYFPNIHSLRSQ